MGTSRIPAHVPLAQLPHGGACLGDRTGLLLNRYDNRPRKISGGRYRRLSPHSGHSATIHVSGIVLTGAGIFSPQPLQRTV